MLLPVELCADSVQLQMQRFLVEKVSQRDLGLMQSLNQVCPVLNRLLHLLEEQEPRFACSLPSNDWCAEDCAAGLLSGQCDLVRSGELQVRSPAHFELLLYLSQMGVFSLVHDAVGTGFVALKLCDGRKRSMSLWVEFITASGYLSARKIRSRLHTLIAQVCDKLSAPIQILDHSGEVKLLIHGQYTVTITPAFHCAGVWPSSTVNWPSLNSVWPDNSLVDQIKADGFDLCSKESQSENLVKRSQIEGDCWQLRFTHAEKRLLRDNQRQKCLSILKTLRDRHLILNQNPISYYLFKSLLLYECEKHPLDSDWIDYCLPYRVNGILLQLISCLQRRHCPHYFMRTLDLFRAKPSDCLDNAARHTWALLRQLLTNPFCFEVL